MTSAPKYASKTSVDPLKTRMEIEQTLQRFGASQFAGGWTDAEAVIQFRAHDRIVRFVLPLPDRTAKHITMMPNGWQSRTSAQVEAIYQQEVRSRWRALLIVIKAKLAAVEAQIATFEDEFMAHILLPDGRTVSETIAPEIERSYETGEITVGMLAIGAGS